MFTSRYLPAAMPQKRPAPAGPPGLAGAYRYAWLGMQFAAGVLVYMGLGYLVDRWLGTLPGFLVGGAILGGVVGFVSVYRRVVVRDGGKDA